MPWSGARRGAAARLLAVALVSGTLGGLAGAQLAAPPAAAPTGGPEGLADGPCPEEAPRARFEVAAAERVEDVTGRGATKRIVFFALLSDLPLLDQGLRRLEPLVVRAHVGDCVEVRLTNGLDRPASLHPHLVHFLASSDGARGGHNEDSLVEPGGQRVYQWFAAREHVSFFHTHASHDDMADGLFGALVVEPAGSAWLDPATGLPLRSGAAAIVTRPGAPDLREFTLFFHDLFLPQTVEAINYRAEPFAGRLARDPAHANVTSSRVHGDPATPLLRAYAGDPVRLHVIGGGPDNFHVVHPHAHQWLAHRGPGPPVPVDAQTFGPSEAFTFDLLGGAGGEQGAVGDFLYHCHVQVHMHRGMWGILRVLGKPVPDLAPLPDRVLPGAGA